MSDHPDTGLVTSYMTLRKFIGTSGTDGRVWTHRAHSALISPSPAAF
jgi:hypothetical protein